MQLFAKSGADLNMKNYYLMSALHSAAIYGLEDILIFLLDSGVDLESKAYWNRTALMLSVASRQPRTFDLLLKRGANVTSEDDFGVTALHLAARRNAVDMIETLMSVKDGGYRDVDLGTFQSRRTPLMEAIEANATETAFLLMTKYGANSLLKDKFGATTLHIASRFGAISILHHLLNATQNK